MKLTTFFNIVTFSLLVLLLTFYFTYIKTIENVQNKPKIKRKLLDREISDPDSEFIFSNFHSIMNDILFESKLVIDAFANISEFIRKKENYNASIHYLNKYNVYDQTISRAKHIASKCSRKSEKKLVILFLQFANELIQLFGNKVYNCRMDDFIHILYSCNTSIDFQFIGYSIVTAFNFQEGGVCIYGHARSLTDWIVKRNYSESYWFMLSIYSMWASKASYINQSDKDAMCAFVDRLADFREEWDVDTKKHICWLSTNVLCTEYLKFDLDELLKTEECVNFLNEAKRIINQ